MTNPPSDGRPGLLGHPPDEVRVTVVLPRRRGAPMRRRVADMRARTRKGIVIGLAVALAIAALGVASQLVDRRGTARGERGKQSLAAYSSAARCLSAAAALDRSPTRDEFDRAVWCERYAGHTRAVSYRFVGAALPALDVSGR